MKRCKVCESSVLYGPWPPDVPGVISPMGVEHIGVDYGDTACGRDATGDDWRWPW